MAKKKWEERKKMGEGKEKGKQGRRMSLGKVKKGDEKEE